MLRITLIAIVCVALAGVGVSGVHVHQWGGSHPGQMAFAHDEGHESHAISVLDNHHGIEHAQHGDIDIDTAIKALGKPSPAQPLLAAAIVLYIVMALAPSSLGSWLAQATVFRPPKPRSAFYFLPPSHAPPRTASLR